jgi:multiple antibiotic resistance protein
LNLLSFQPLNSKIDVSRFPEWFPTVAGIIIATLMTTVMVLVKFFGLAFSALLPLINPLGSALIFLGFVGREPAAILLGLARRIAINTVLFLAFVELAGKTILDFFGISLPVVEVAGGLVLASMGWKLLNQEVVVKSHPAIQDVSQNPPSSFQEMVFYPFTFPITAGPGSVVVMLTLSANASAKQALPDAMAHIGILVAVMLLSALVFLCYGYAPWIRDRIAAQTVHGILRITAFVLLCIGVQITANGATAMVHRMVST